MLKLFRFLAFLFCFIHCPNLSAAQFNYSTAYRISDSVEDLSSPTIDARYEEFVNDLSLGYQKEAIWIRLTVHPIEGTMPRTVFGPTLRISPYQIAEVDLFELIDGRWRQTPAGAIAARRNDNPCFDGQHCFSINRKAAGPVYIRVRTPTILTLSLELVDLTTARSDSAARISNLSVAFTIASGLLLIAILLAVAERSALAYAFLFLQTTVLFSLTGANGELAGWFPQISPAAWFVFTLLAITTRTLAIASLLYAVIYPYVPHRLFFYLMWGVFGTQILCILMVLTGFASLAMQINLATMSSLPLIGLFGVLTARDMPQTTKRILTASGLIFAFTLALLLMSSTQLFSNDNAPLVTGLADRKLNGMGFALFVLWFIVSENTRTKSVALKEKQKMQLMIAESTQQALAAKERGMLIDMMTHEIKNPLGTIRLAAAALWAQSDGAPTTKERFQRLMASVNRINGLLEQVSLSNKIAHMDEKLQKEPFDVGQLLKDLTEDFDDADRFEVHASSPMLINLNKPLFTIALENLMVNAHKYSLPGSPIFIFVDPLIPANKHDKTTGPSAEGTGLKVRVTNQIQPDAYPDLSMLFKPYYRHAAVGEQPGMGLGLSLVKATINKMGGVIDVYIEGDRINFEVSLP